LLDTYAKEEGTVLLELDNIEPFSWNVICMVRLAHYPDLGYATHDTPITVTGRITEAGGGEVQLEDVALAFPDTDSRMEEQAAEQLRHQALKAQHDSQMKERAAEELLHQALKAQHDDLRRKLMQQAERAESLHADALTTRLFMRAPVLSDLPRNRPIAVVTVLADLDGNRLANEIFSFLKENGYRLKTDAVEFVPNRLLMRGCFVVDRVEYLELDVNFQQLDP
jgi:hypothetical protein